MTPDALSGLYARAFRESRPWSADEFRSLLNDPHVFLEVRGAAFALGRVIADEAELLTIATDPDYRRQGLARACLSAFEDTAGAHGASTAFLEVAADNTAAHRLYETQGYAIVARRPGYYHRANGAAADALIMRRSFDA